MTQSTEDQIKELFEFVDAHPDLSEEELLDQLEQKFPREVINEFTGAMTGFAPPQPQTVENPN